MSTALLVTFFLTIIFAGVGVLNSDWLCKGISLGCSFGALIFVVAMRDEPQEQPQREVKCPRAPQQERTYYVTPGETIKILGQTWTVPADVHTINITVIPACGVGRS